MQTDSVKKYYIKNKEKILQLKKEYRFKNSKKIKLKDKKRYNKNKAKILKQKKLYFAKNKTKIASSIKIRYHTDINYRLGMNLRNRLRQAINKNYKSGSAVRDLGCSIDKLKLWLEMHFEEGMSWDNQGLWHIDHKVPLSKFDLTDRKQLLEAVHFTNLQPMWAEDNLSKGDRI